MIKINKETGCVEFENEEDRKGGPVYLDGKVIGYAAGEIDDGGRLLVGRKGTMVGDAMEFNQTIELSNQPKETQSCKSCVSGIFGITQDDRKYGWACEILSDINESLIKHKAAMVLTAGIIKAIGKDCQGYKAK